MAANQQIATAKTKVNIRVPKTSNFRVSEYPSLTPIRFIPWIIKADVILQGGLIDPYPPLRASCRIALSLRRAAAS